MTDFKRQNILIIDDDKRVVRFISKYLTKMHLFSDSCYNLNDGLTKLSENDFDLVFLDVNLPDGNGINAIAEILDNETPPPVIIMTAYYDPDGAEMAINCGAWDYLHKPLSLKDLKLQALSALAFQKQKKQNIDCSNFEAPDIIGESAAIQKSINYASQIVSSESNVLITGETGTGKELFAKAIHDNSPRRKGDFIVVDCSVLSENLIESVLFGHEKGAFTGAEKRRKGLVELANGGTLFLDEVGELSEPVQSSFLRVLQEKKFRPVGSERELFSDFRVICATNKNLDKMVSKRVFRSDLFFRLQTFLLKLPPIRERKEDVSPIVTNEIQKRCKLYNIPTKEIASDYLDTLKRYDWPGNVRELINTIETSITKAQFEDTLFSYHIPSNIRAKVTREKISDMQTGPMKNTAGEFLPESLTYKTLIDQTEKKYLTSLFTITDGDIQSLIKLTGLSRAVLYRKLKKSNIG